MSSDQYTTVLNNGIRLLIKPMPGMPTIDFRYYILSGSFYTPKGKFELSHLLEHVVLLGNKRQPDPAKFASEMERYTSAWGGMNSRYLNTFWYRKSSRHFDEFLELASSQLLDPVIKDSAVEEQIEVIRQELNQKSVNDGSQRFYRGYQSLLPELFPDYSARIESLASVTPNDVRQYHKRNFVTSNTAVAITGNVDTKDIDQIETKLNSLLAGYPTGNKNDFVPPEPNLQPAKIIEFTPSNQKLVHFSLNFTQAGRHIDDMAALKVLQALWGGGKGARFYQKIRRSGLTYSTQSVALLEYEMTRLTLWDQIDPNNLTKFLKLAVSELSELAKGNFTDDELERAKLFRVEREITAYPTPGAWISAFGDDWALGLERPTAEDLATQTELITKDDIIAIAKKYLPSWQLTIGNNHGSSPAELKELINRQL